MNKNKKRGHLITKIVAGAVALAILTSTILTILGVVEVRSTYLEMVEEELHLATVHLQVQLSNEYDGDWDYNEAKGLLKGETAVGGIFQSELDGMKTDTGIEYTLFYGDTRVVTTLTRNDGSRLVGTQASAAVVATVLEGGKNYYSSNVVIEGKNYYGYYVPLKNTFGGIAGMAFCGRESTSITNALIRITAIMIGVAAALAVVMLIAGIYIANRTTKDMTTIAKDIEQVSNGNLNIVVAEKMKKRNDELGIIATNTDRLAQKLHSVISTSRGLASDVSRSGSELSDSANLASSASNQVTDAVDDISKGAVNQAESVQDSAGNVNEIGNDIEIILGSVNVLSDNTKLMKDACNNSMAALDNLMNQNEDVIKSMSVIYDQIQNTNSAVQNISGATKLITDIASQTNLLALNASIEAARAGEAGKGFAVVATEIGSLADQSKEATVEINKIVHQLIEESQKSVETIEELNSAFEEQSRQIAATKNDMKHLEDGVNSVTDNTGEISGRIGNLDSLKGNLVSIIEDLSAISEENAASTEETTASMEELNASFEIINQSAEKLKDVAAELEEQISYFTI